MLKKISTLYGFKKLSKEEQSEIEGGHFFSGFFCKAGCALTLDACVRACPVSDTISCAQNCQIEYNCCIDTCAPEGGEIQ